MKPLVCSLVCACLLLTVPARASAQTAWVERWLTEYAAADTRATVVDRLSTVGDLNILLDDLELLLESWLEDGDSPDERRRVIAAFALDAAYARSGNRAEALRYMQEAREMATALGQSALLASIEKDLQALRQAQSPQ